MDAFEPPTLCETILKAALALACPVICGSINDGVGRGKNSGAYDPKAVNIKEMENPPYIGDLVCSICLIEYHTIFDKYIIVE